MITSDHDVFTAEMVGRWRTWAEAQDDVDPDRPTKSDLWKCYAVAAPALALVGEGGHWYRFLEALAEHGYVAEHETT
jgi:hypothetical protein